MIGPPQIVAITTQQPDQSTPRLYEVTVTLQVAAETSTAAIVQAVAAYQGEA